MKKEYSREQEFENWLKLQSPATSTFENGRYRVVKELPKTHAPFYVLESTESSCSKGDVRLILGRLFHAAYVSEPEKTGWGFGPKNWSVDVSWIPVDTYK